MNLDAITPREGTQAYVNEFWISDLDRQKMRAHTPEGQQTVYEDGTYDWYGGVTVSVKPVRILEIGVYLGYSVAAMLYTLTPFTVKQAVLVDNGKESNHTRNAVRRLQAEFTEVDFTYHEIDSQDEWQEVERDFFDIVHIDADHSYEGVKNDLKHFGTLISPGGVIICHDTKDPCVYRACMDFATVQGLAHRQIDNIYGHVLMAYPE